MYSSCGIRDPSLTEVTALGGLIKAFIPQPFPHSHATMPSALPSFNAPLPPYPLPSCPLYVVRTVSSLLSPGHPPPLVLLTPLSASSSFPSHPLPHYPPYKAPIPASFPSLANPWLGPPPVPLTPSLQAPGSHQKLQTNNFFSMVLWTFV